MYQLRKPCNGYKVTETYLTTVYNYCTCMNFMATSLNPFCSNLLMISAMRPLWTASGLSMRNVRSLLSAILRTFLLATVPEQATDFRREFLEGMRMSRHVGWASIVHIRKYTFLGEGRVVARSSFSQTGWATKLRTRMAVVRRQSNNLVITTNFSNILKRPTEICALPGDIFRVRLTLNNNNNK